MEVKVEQEDVLIRSKEEVIDEAYCEVKVEPVDEAEDIRQSEDGVQYRSVK